MREPRRGVLARILAMCVAAAALHGCRDQPAPAPPDRPGQEAHTPRPERDALRHLGPPAIDRVLARQLAPPDAASIAAVELDAVRDTGLVEAWLPTLARDVLDDDAATVLEGLLGPDAPDLEVAVAWLSGPVGARSASVVVVGDDALGEVVVAQVAGLGARLAPRVGAHSTSLAFHLPPGAPADPNALDARATRLADALDVQWHHRELLSETSLVVGDAEPATWSAWLGPHGLVVTHRAAPDVPDAVIDRMDARLAAAQARPAPLLWPLHTALFELRVRLGDETGTVLAGVGVERLHLDLRIPLDASGIDVERAEGLVRLLESQALVPDSALHSLVAEGPWPSAMDDAAVVMLRNSRLTLDRDHRRLDLLVRPPLADILAAAP